MVQGHNQAEMERFFSALTENAFVIRLGVADPPLIDYLVNLMLRFVRCDALFRLRDLEGKSLEEVGAMLAEAEQRLGDARREVHRHIGDFTLFWTGVYPEALQKLCGSQRRDHLLNYWQQGKLSYHIASQIPRDDRPSENRILQRLSQQFEMCAYGLGEVRRAWERADAADDPGPCLT